MNAVDWITEFADLLEIEPPDIETFEGLLDLAAVAAHASERIAAPIACYLVGVAGVGAEEAMEMAHRVARGE